MNNHSSKGGAIVALASISLIAVVVFTIFGMWVKYSNATARFHNQFTAQEKKIEASFDDMWKSIQQIAQVDNKYREDIKNIVTGYAEARSGGGGSLATLVTEAIPNIDSSTANRLIGVIDGRREGFKRDQQILASIAQDNNNVVDTFPGSLFLGADKRLEARMVTSSRTQAAIEARTDDDVSVY